MTELILRFMIGGVIVSAFAVAGDVLKPKSFAGLFAAAPSVALATLSLTILKNGAAFAALESRSMLAGAFAFFLYAVICCQLMMRFKVHAALAAITSLVLWLFCAAGGWGLFLR